MRKLLLIIVFFCCSSVLKAQNFGNEWINYNQQYFKIKVVQEGIYRINYQTLQAAGIPLGSINPRRFQVFCRGQEQYIYVEGEDDGVFNTSDFIEFYATRNNGYFDAQLYKINQIQANPEYSLFNDTAVYFLTWNNQLNNKRLQVENDVSFGSYTPITHFFRESRQNYTSAYYFGETNSYGTSDPEYTTCEGWFDNSFYLGGGVTKNIPTPNRYLSGPDAKVRFAVTGQSNYTGLYLDHHLRAQFCGITFDTIFEGYKLIQMEKDVPVSALGNVNTSFVFSSINDLGSGADRNALVYISVKYPHAMELGNATSYTLFIPPSAQAKTYISFTGFQVATGEARLYDLTFNKRIKVVKTGNNYQALIPNPAVERKCYLSSDAQAIQVNTLIPVSTQPGTYAQFTNFLSGTPNYNFVFVTHTSLLSAVKTYENYRKSVTGGNFKTLVVDAEELYDQFSHGIRKHPLGIRNFLRYAWQNFSSPIDYVYLVGKSYSPDLYRNNAQYYSGTLVPTMGNPCSDFLLMNGILDTLWQPAAAIGRLSAKTPVQVTDYLEKVQQYDMARQNPQEWMKRILHFSGGVSATEQAQISAYLSGFKSIIQDTLFGGNVITFYKNSTAPIQINLSEQIKAYINSGVVLMTFFGHAAGVGFDISIDNPAEYQNQGKYPFLLANSCFAGDIFGSETSSSDEFVLIKNKGVIGYLASITKAVSSVLNIYSAQFYKQISVNAYGKGVGKAIKQTIANIQTPSTYIKEICLEMTLHGDPAVALYAHPKPDYVINSGQVYFTPSNVSTELDSFTLYMVPSNIGRAVKSSFVVEIERTFPDGKTKQIISKRINAPYYCDTIAIRFPVDPFKGEGLNSFKILLDAYNEVDEMDNVLNNSVTVTLFIKSASIYPVYPAKYAIIPSSSIQLKAFTSYPFAGNRTYVFQLDTTPLFNSPFKQQAKITQGGGLVNWTPSVTFTDSMVYFWRVGVDSTSASGYNWKSSSFQYIDGLSGWSQARFSQFYDNQYQFVNINKNQKIFEYINTVYIITAQTGFFAPGVTTFKWDDEWYKINASILDVFSCADHGMKFVVIDPVSGKPWTTTNVGGAFGQFGNLHCKSYNGIAAFDFSTVASSPPISSVPVSEAEWHNRMANFLNGIPNGYYVLAYNHRNHNAQNYSNALYTAFESIGSGVIRSLQNNLPYIIFGKKGSLPGTAKEIVGTSMNATILLRDSFSIKWDEGIITSEMIGPAKKWNSLHWRVRSYETNNTDSVRLNVIGITSSGSEVKVINGLTTSQGDITNLDLQIDAAMYPYLKLELVSKDTAKHHVHTPAHPVRWQVTFDGTPETTLDPTTYFRFHADTLQEGDKLKFAIAMRNIGQYDMDSLLVKYWISDKQNVIHPVATHRLAPHPKGSVLTDSVQYSTLGLAGNNSFWVEVNPDNDQPEQMHQNNLGEKPFYVKKDVTNPLMDVTFDGVHILNGDIVSGKPEILVTLFDDNPYMKLDQLSDTSAFEFYLQSPGQQTPQRIPFMQGATELMTFYPATANSKTCKIRLQPELKRDGTYFLTIQAKDKSSNKSGNVDYNISFEVINKPTITEVMNWPNPFSTFTRFVFTLTGNEVPDDFRIQIMTISGRVVKELTQAELGTVHIGRNITQGGWDGTDEFGDRLANGVYLYRVIARLNGKKLDLQPTEASGYFKHEFGKMYLLR